MEQDDYVFEWAMKNPIPATKEKHQPLWLVFFFGCRLWRAGFEPTTFGSLFVRAFGTGE